MSGLRYDRIVASTALAVILAAPIGAGAAPKAGAPKVAAVPAATTTAAQPPTEVAGRDRSGGGAGCPATRDHRPAARHAGGRHCPPRLRPRRHSR